MARWHDQTCQKPDMDVQDGVPHCRTCGSEPPLAYLIAQQPQDGPLWSVPPDEESGQMNLHWPPSVPYSGTAGTTEEPSAGPLEQQRLQLKLPNNFQPDNFQRDDDASSPLSSAESEPSVVYERRLETGELRLIYLSDVDNRHRVVHLSLETYRHDACPEYEATSYAWAGENEDSRQSSPVYVGEYWDVLLQTRNCWDMLYHLRPARGVRSVWVDAICINQRDVTERGAQVATMRTIFQRSLRVFVYLGRDIVGPPSTDRAAPPPRYDLHEISKIKPRAVADLKALLHLRYFTRVWVIQELLTSPGAIIPLEGAEFIAGPLTARFIEKNDNSWHWSSTSTPWMQYINSRSLMQEKGLFNVLKMTRDSYSTDPRDKVFGVLGLVMDNVSLAGLKPDYSLSSVHIYIGVFAYTLIKLERVEVLICAAGEMATSPLPSWLPDWRGHRCIGKHPFWPHDAVEGSPADLTDDYYNYIQSLVKNNETFGRWPFDTRAWSYSTFLLHPLKKCQESRETSEISWNSHPSVRTKTGALCLNLFHLLTISAPPEQLRRPDRSPSMFGIRSGRCALYFFAPPTALAAIYRVEIRLNLFVLAHGLRLFLLFMQRVSFGTYRLLECSECYGLFLIAPSPNKTVDGPLEVDLHSTLYTELTDVLLDLGNIESKPVISDARLSVYERSALRAVFLGSTYTWRELLPVFQGHLISQKAFIESWLDFHKKHRPFSYPVADSKWFYTTVFPAEWQGNETLRADFSNSNKKWEYFEPPSGLRSPSNLWQPFNAWMEDRWFSKPIRVRLDIAAIWTVVQDDLVDYFRTISRLSRWTKITGESETSMILRGPRYADHFVQAHNWPEELREEFKVDGAWTRVTIV